MGVIYFTEKPFQLIHVIVIKFERFGEAEPACIYDACMVFTVAEYVITPAGNGSDNTQICLVAGTEGQCGIFPNKFCQLFLQLQVECECSIKEPGA